MATTQTYDSPDRRLRFLVTRSDDGDVSLGFDGYAWHTHADLLAATYGMSEDQAIERFVKDLIGNRTVIAVSMRSGAVCNVRVTDDPQKELQYKPDDETIELRYWDGSPAG